MIKPIKFDLPIDKSTTIRSLDQLRNTLTKDHLSAIVHLARNGRLGRFLQAHGRRAEYQRVIEALSAHKQDEELFVVICQALGVSGMGLSTRRADDKSARDVSHTPNIRVERKTIMTAFHESNITELCKEAQRLLGIELTLLGNILEEPGVLAGVREGEQQSYDRTTARKQIEVLEGERTKLGDLEMVLAVVGTMKAGKSTTINAIVGTEVLPNRNRPMTTLPTLIRHTRGQIEPVLRFENDQPIHQLMGQLSQAMQLPENQSIVRRLNEDAVMKRLLAQIREGINPRRIYQGVDAIFEFLKELNDLVRLCHEIKLEFPFGSYDEIHELPVIEVEFVHLRETDEAGGRLTLLDTPGPNESGQRHLRSMLKEQIHKASAVLAVFDYTQLKSDADAEVRGQLLEIAAMSQGRLYALVNKFDEKDRHGDGEDQVRDLVAATLMEGQIRPEHVFPVSSRLAYLANRARHELSVNRRLPDPEQQPWVADFGEEALGRRWENKIDDMEEVEKSVEALWKDSLFHAPLERVIKTAHAQAAVLAVDAAAAKLVDTAQRMDNLLNIRETALSKSARELLDHINKLQQDIARVDHCETQTRTLADNMLKELSEASKALFDEVKKDAMAELDKYFLEGKTIERRSKGDMADSRQGRKNRPKNTPPGTRSIDDFFKELRRRRHETRPLHTDRIDFDPNDPVIKLDSRSDAQALLQSIEISISEIIGHSENAMKEGMDEVIADFHEEFLASVLTEAKLIIDETQHRLNEGGFSITLDVPNTSMLALTFSGSEALSNLIEAKTESVTRWKRSEGIWGTVCSWFNTDDWGWETYEATKDVYHVDIRNIRQSIINQIEDTFRGLDQSILFQIKQPLHQGISEFFEAFTTALEQIRGDLSQGLRDQEKSKAEQEDLTQRLRDLKKNMPDLKLDAHGIKHEVERLL